jgi:hypothetical protein
MIELLEYPEYLSNIADEYIEHVPSTIKRSNEILTYFILLWFLSKFVYETNEVWSLDTISQVGGVDRDTIIRQEKELFNLYLNEPMRLNKLIFSRK